MADLRFSGGGSDRRRRILANDRDSSGDFEFEETVPLFAGDSRAAAFPLLSRDRLIRRVVSPRLWKHVVLTSVLLLIPAALAVVRMPSALASTTPAAGIHSGGIVAILRGLTGLELFLAGQLCLLICWVRGASAVDFRGGYRTWRWMSIILLFASLLLVTGASFALTDLLAGFLAPMLGVIESARPALLIVPLGAVTVFVLRFVISDMGRCRPAQILAIAAAALAMLRIVSGLRGPMKLPGEGLAILELLTSGLVLSACELHCWYVIHVNPNPPVAAGTSSDLVKPECDRIDTASTIKALGSETVVVSAWADSAPATAIAPQPVALAVEPAEVPAPVQPAVSGRKPSRGKQRKAG